MGMIILNNGGSIDYERILLENRASNRIAETYSQRAIIKIGEYLGSNSRSSFYSLNEFIFKINDKNRKVEDIFYSTEICKKIIHQTCNNEKNK